MIKTPPIIVILTIGNEQKTVHLVQMKECWSIYNILMDNVLQGQVQKTGKSWSVITHAKSLIQNENHQAFIDALNRTIGNITEFNS